MAVGVPHSSLPPSFRSFDSSINVNRLEFVNKLEERLTCPVCKDVLQKPMQMSCGHHVCYKCVEIVFKNENVTTCPVNVDEDCQNIDRKDVYPDASVSREVMKLKVKCPNNKFGCSEVTSLQKLPDHLKKCEYKGEKCPYTGCNEELPMNQIDEHKKKCEYKPVECECKQQIPQKNLEEHKLNECREANVICPYGCNSISMIPRKHLLQHVEVCPNKPESCAFSYFGCRQKGTKAEIEEHIKIGTQEHLQKVAIYVSTQEASRAEQQSVLNVPDDIKSKISANERELKDLKLKIVAQTEKFLVIENRVSELPRKSVFEDQGRKLNDLTEKVAHIREQIQNMDGGATLTRYGTLNNMTETFANQISTQDRLLGQHDVRLAEMDLRFQIMESVSYNGVIIWKIKDYHRRKQDAINGRTLSLYSQPFYTSKYGYKMCVRTYLNGDGMGRNTHMSLFFVVMGGEFDSLLPWPFQQKVTLYVLDQSREARHLSDHFHPDATSSSFKRPVTEMNVASGCPLFAGHAVLENRNNNYIKDDTIFIRCNVDTTNLQNF